MKQYLKTKIVQAGFEMVLPAENTDLTAIKLIVVGDNPGKKERKEKAYFVGSAGKALCQHFKDTGLATDFAKECALFNKTCVSTDNTIGLKKIREGIGQDLFNDLLETSADEIAALANKLPHIPILVFGKTELNKGGLFEAFWFRLNAMLHNKENLLVFSHPSYKHFSNEWGKYKEKFPHHTAWELLFEIGKINAAVVENSY